jgi:hypothetical protein
MDKLLEPLQGRLPAGGETVDRLHNVRHHECGRTFVRRQRSLQ